MERPKAIVGIDPGAKGGLASYITTFEPPGEPRWGSEKLSETPQDRFEQLKGCADAASRLETPPVAILEAVGGFVGVPQPGSAMFQFGRGYGQLEGFLIALGFSVYRVTPQKWQRGLGLVSRKGETKADHKRRLRSKALDLFPALKPTLDTCDAILILYWYITEVKDVL